MFTLSFKSFTMKYKKIVVVPVLMISLFCATSSLRAQDEQSSGKGFDKSKLFFGGNFGLSFGDYTVINISPQAGYRFNPYFAAGAGVNFIYSSFRYRYNDPSYDYRENYGVTGLNIFGRVYPIQYLFVQAQPELNYVWGKVKYYDGTPSQKLDGQFVPSLLGGAGAAIPAGRGAFYVLLEYDILQNDRSPYGNRAIYNFGYNFGF